MIIPSRWIRLWLQCVYLKVGDPPGKIDMYSLLQFDSGVEGGWRPKKNLQPPVLNDTEDSPGHYRRVSLPAWLQFVELYGVDGYAIAVVSCVLFSLFFLYLILTLLLLRREELLMTTFRDGEFSKILR